MLDLETFYAMVRKKTGTNIGTPVQETIAADILDEKNPSSNLLTKNPLTKPPSEKQTIQNTLMGKANVEQVSKVRAQDTALNKANSMAMETETVSEGLPKTPKLPSIFLQAQRAASGDNFIAKQQMKFNTKGFK